MLKELLRHWWVLAIRGLVAILFGVLALAWPEAALAIMVILFGVYALSDGLIALVQAGRTPPSSPRWWALVLEGVSGVAAGLLSFMWPGATALMLLYVIAAWAAVTGVMKLIAALHLRTEAAGEVLLALSGVASVVLGVLLAARPLMGLQAMIIVVGIYALFFGALLVGLAFRLKSLAARL